MKIFNRFFGLIMVACLSLPTVVFADDGGVLSMVQALQKQMATMQQTIDTQQQTINTQNIKIERLEKGIELEYKPAGDFEKNLEASIGKSSKWLKDLDFKGDLRMRYEAIDFTPGETIKGVRDRNRFRYQLRFGWEKKLFDDLKLGFWLASGDSAGGTSTNSTFDTDFAKKLIWIERVYLTYHPEFVDGLEITAGKFKNPLVTTDILWDSDIRPEGVYEKYDFSLFNGDVKPFVTLGQWILQEDSLGAPGDSELFVYQSGFKWRASNDFVNDKPLDIKFATSFYNLTEHSNTFSATGGNAAQASGALAQEDFDIGDIYLEAKFTPFELGGKAVPLKFFGHFVKNFGDEALLTATTTEDQDYAYNYGLQMGDLKKQGDWRIKWRYSYIGPSAVAGNLVDADFGGANRRGFETAIGYQLRNNLRVELTGNFSGNVTGTDTEQRMIHTDVSMKF